MYDNVTKMTPAQLNEAYGIEVDDVNGSVYDPDTCRNFSSVEVWWADYNQSDEDDAADAPPPKIEKMSTNRTKYIE